jgi:hypothetical protein
MRRVAAATIFLLLTGAAHAAEWNTMWRQEKYCPPDRKVPYCDPDRVAKEREIDEAYQDAIKSQPEPATAADDPWGGVRAGETAQDKKRAR